MYNDHLIQQIKRSISILEVMPSGVEFDQETLEFFQQLMLWRRPDKFFCDDNQEHKIISGRVAAHRSSGIRTLQFTFDNGYIWMASIAKLANRKVYRRCKIEVLKEIWGDKEDIPNSWHSNPSDI